VHATIVQLLQHEIVDFLSAGLWPTQQPTGDLHYLQDYESTRLKKSKRLVEVWQCNNAELE